MMPRIHSAYVYGLRPKENPPLEVPELATELRLPYSLVYTVMTGRVAPGANFIAHLVRNTRIPITDLFDIERIAMGEDEEPSPPPLEPFQRPTNEPDWALRDPDPEPAHTDETGWEWWAYRDAIKNEQWKKAAKHRARAEAREHDLTPDEITERAEYIRARLKAGKKVKPL